MIGKGIGFGFASARDTIARLLVRTRITPNMLSVTGMGFTAGASVCFALGATSGFGWSLEPLGKQTCYPLAAGVLIVLASACDMLDGAVARIGGKGTRFGAFLDSTLDRYSDFAVYAGIAGHYALQNPANATFTFLSMLAFFNAFMISYTRARAEDLIDACRVGYWQRGERSAAILIGTFSYNIPALVLQQATLPLMSALRRIFYTKAALEGKTPSECAQDGPWWVRIQPWRWPRATVPYDIITGLNIAWLVLARIPSPDPLRNWVGA